MCIKLVFYLLLVTTLKLNGYWFDYTKQCLFYKCIIINHSDRYLESLIINSSIINTFSTTALST